MKDLTILRDKDYAGLGKTQRRIMDILDNIDEYILTKAVFQIPDFVFDMDGTVPQNSTFPENAVSLQLDEIAFHYFADNFPVTKRHCADIYRAIKTLKKRGLVDTFVAKSPVDGEVFVSCWSLGRDTESNIRKRREMRNNMIEENDPYEKKLNELNSLLEFFRNEWGLDYFCGLFSDPWEWKKMEDFEMHYSSFPGGSQGYEVYSMVSREWTEKRWPKKKKGEHHA